MRCVMKTALRHLTLSLLFYGLLTLPFFILSVQHDFLHKRIFRYSYRYREMAVLGLRATTTTRSSRGKCRVRQAVNHAVKAGTLREVCCVTRYPSKLYFYYNGCTRQYVIDDKDVRALILLLKLRVLLTIAYAVMAYRQMS